VHTFWEKAPDVLKLNAGEIHVWRAWLSKLVINNRETLLSKDEKTRADRFYFERDRDDFIAARALLRILLGKYLQTSPHVLRFAYSEYGKPVLMNDANHGGLCFNVSHSNGLVLYALSRNRQVGIDVESIKTDVAGERIAERFFSPDEAKILKSCPEPAQATVFFNCWTRKEAYIKAVGKGLTFPLDHVEVLSVTNHERAVLSIKNDPIETARWSVSDIFPAHGYAAALVAEGHDWLIKYLDWSESSTC
jgi:4'-phosphopantetheinyl transferase